MHALSPIALPPAELAAKRKRARNTLVAGVALGSTGHIAAVTVGTIVAHELIGTQALAGAPGATVVLGAALGAVLLSALMARRGRRVGLVSGYSIGVVGAFVATAAVLTRSFPLLLLGTMLIGFGNASNSLSRYTAADMVKTDRRASAIGTVVWASTVGSVVGPTLVPIAGEIALQAGLPPLAGPYLVPVVFVGLAAILSFVFLRPDPYELADEDAVALAVPGDTTTERVWSIMRRPGGVRRDHRARREPDRDGPDHDDDPAPHDRARPLARRGRDRAVRAHAGHVRAVAPLRLAHRTVRGGADDLPRLGDRSASPRSWPRPRPPMAALILRPRAVPAGPGWNFGFVAGSALLSQHLELHERTRVQGAADALIWSSAAAASLGSGLIMAAVGYTALGILGAAAVIIPVLVLRAHRRSVQHAHAAPEVELPAA